MKNASLLILILALLTGFLSVSVTAEELSPGGEFKRIDSVPLDALYGYDRNLPFNLDKKVRRETALTITYELYYDSANNERVPAVLTIPKRKGPHPVIIFMHGHGMKKDLGETADVLIGQKGYAFFAIDAQYRNERKRKGHDIISEYVYSSRDAFIQTVIDNMRGIDILETVEEIDSDRIGVMGLSMGTFIGSVLFSLDDRIRVGAFGVGGANWMKVGEKSIFGPLYSLKMSGKSLEEIFSAYNPIDPMHYAHRTKGRPVFMVNGRLDELVPAEAALALYGAFGEPRQMKWFDGGHVPSVDTIFELVDEMFDYFNKYLKRKAYHPPWARDPDENRPPVASGLEVIPDDGQARQNGLIEFKVKAEDPDRNIIFVKVWLDCGSDMTLLYDDGRTSGDEKKRDGVYTGRHRIYEKAALGESLVRAVAVDRWGETSDEIIAVIDVKPIEYPEGAHAPEITKLELPDEIRIGEKIHFEVHADDPDGDLTHILITIDEIGLTLSMPPDKDGVVKQDFSIPDLIPAGEYHFTFQAKDKTKMYSEPVEGVARIRPAD